MQGQKILNQTLMINSAFSMISGLDFIFFDRRIMNLLSEKDLGTLLPIGLMLVVFSIFVFTVSRMKEVNRYLVGSIILIDSMWVIGSILLDLMRNKFVVIATV
jgi:glucan phosphoethanolaminetransferase (alkaline phosphatase superfamily)